MQTRAEQDAAYAAAVEALIDRYTHKESRYPKVNARRDFARERALQAASIGAIGTTSFYASPPVPMRELEALRMLIYG